MLRQIPFPYSLAWTYSRITQFLASSRTTMSTRHNGLASKASPSSRMFSLRCFAAGRRDYFAWIAIRQPLGEPKPVRTNSSVKSG